MAGKQDEPLSESEIAERMDRAVRRMIQTPPQPRVAGKKKKRPASKGRVRKGRTGS
jgi:hypothetical protein